MKLNRLHSTIVSSGKPGLAAGFDRARIRSQILGAQAGMAHNTREHFPPNFFSVVKCEDEIRSSLFERNAVRSALPRGAPSWFAARPQVPDARGWPAIRSCCGKDLRESRNRFTMFNPIREDTQRQRLDLHNCFVAALPAGHHARKVRHLRQ
jgi:hypothetical protein